MKRIEALAKGVVRYQGNPCKRGHAGERFSSTGNCVQCLYVSRNEKRRSAPRPDRKVVRTKYRERRLALMRSLKDRPCMDCGGRFHPCAMDFDHREASEKKFTIAMLGKFVGHARLMEEVAKCDIICANCHRLRTFNRRDLSKGD